MEGDPKPKNPNDPELAPPPMPYPSQQPPSMPYPSQQPPSMPYPSQQPPSMSYPSEQPPPNYAEVASIPAYPQPYHPNQFAPGPQRVVYQQVQYAVPVVTAPPVTGAGLAPTYDDYMCWSIISLLCCCLPLGVVALIFSCKTQEANARQDAFSARSHSSAARTLNVIAMVIGVLTYIFVVIFMVMIPQIRN